MVIYPFKEDRILPLYKFLHRRRRIDYPFHRADEGYPGPLRVGVKGQL